MKYLKRFEEDKSLKRDNLESELKELCNDYLPYLLDSGFEANIFSAMDTYITISKREYDNIKLPIFNWLDVKDELIPFIEILKRDFRISNDSICFSGYQPVRKLSEYSRDFNISELERIPDNATCKYINIKINP